MGAIYSEDSPFPGDRGVDLDTACRHDIWDKTGGGFLAEFVKVPRDQVVGFALYTHDHGVLKMSAQLYPLQEGEAREVRLELKTDGQWREVAKAPVIYPGWSAHFRLEDWDNTRDVPYRVRHGEAAMFEGLIRKDPIDKEVIVVGSLSCNSNADRGDRETIVRNLKTAGPRSALLCRRSELRPQGAHGRLAAVGTSVPRDHQGPSRGDDSRRSRHRSGQLWGEGGIVAESPAGDTGGYYYPAEYIRMVDRCQTWHLPDPADPRPIAQGIGRLLHATARGRRRLRHPRGPQVQDAARTARFRRWGRGPTTSTRPGTIRRRSICRDSNCWATGRWRSSTSGARTGRARG